MVDDQISVTDAGADRIDDPVGNAHFAEGSLRAVEPAFTAGWAPSVAPRSPLAPWRRV